MSLPPGFLDELRNRVTLSSVVGRKVTWDMRKSNQAKGDFWAPCPFHQEKSASFHVDDRKGFYYCFGCHAKGDALGFLKESENLSFMEAVEMLAREAGMQMPARDPQAAQKADRRTQLAEVMEEVVKFYRLQYRAGSGQMAREYVGQKRRLSDQAQDRWEIGWAPDSRNALLNTLKGKGVPPDLMVATGMIAKGEDGSLYDRFRARVIFPIRDARGRAISLGGRSLDPNARAKYLNGPETELFDKGRNLFNHAPAREAAGKGRPLIVGEGYMDVIAMVEAGFPAAVAPLGTAITEDQLRLMWRISPEPIITLDGDTAGQRAALRVIDLALPLLEAGQGLRFAVLPQGLDPDDLLKQKGAPALQEVLDQALPMVTLLWKRETEGQDFDSPERKAALDKRLRAALARIQDPSIRSHYGEDIKELRWSLFRRGRRPARDPERPFGAPGGFRPAGGRGSRGGAGFGQRFQAVEPVATTLSSMLATSAEEDGILRLRLSVVLATLCLYPQLIDRHESQIERLVVQDPAHRHLRQVVLVHAHDADPDTCATRLARAAGEALETLLADPQIRIQPHILRRGDADCAEKCVAMELAKLLAQWGAEAELRDAAEEIGGLADEGLTWRVSQAARAVADAEKGPEAARAEGVVAPNGVELDRDELDHAKRTWDSIDFTRGGKARK
ncbi:MAG: DNA primase [Gemmobacter sp.]|uniref:DNA primase n=1 Tax=Gemmobacter sp. TaxID=1898957 RepID=UPI001A5E7862|nr:DNA primase [Gemmobacter sp.]MBL8560973.1 DNA primase [Gemmobacter sp.]